MAVSRQNLHTMVPAQACIQGVLKVKVKVKGLVRQTLLSLQENRFFTHTNGWIVTKLAHDGSRGGLHLCCAQGQVQGQRSRDRDTLVISLKSLVLGGRWLDRDQTCT